MSEDLTFAKPPMGGSALPESRVESELEFYHATPSTTHPVFRFVGPSTHGTAATAAKQFSKIAAAGDRPIGILVPHVHDAVGKEYYDAILVGEKGRVIHTSTWPLYVEAGAGITDGEVKPMAEIMSDVDGKAVLMTATAGDIVAGHAVGTATVDSVVYVRVIPTLSGRVA